MKLTILVGLYNFIAFPFHTLAHAHAHTRLHTCACTHTHTHIHTRTRTRTHTCAHTCAHACSFSFSFSLRCWFDLRLVCQHSVEVDPEVSETICAFYDFSIEGDCWHCLSNCFVVEGAPQGLRLAWIVEVPLSVVGAWRSSFQVTWQPFAHACTHTHSFPSSTPYLSSHPPPPTPPPLSKGQLYPCNHHTGALKSLSQSCYSILCVQDHIFKLMKSDSYSRYLRSDQYKEYLSGTRKKVRLLPGIHSDWALFKHWPSMNTPSVAQPPVQLLWLVWGCCIAVVLS